MTLTLHSIESSKSDKINLTREIIYAVASAALMSIGEAAVGLIPLITHLIMVNYSRPLFTQLSCLGKLIDAKNCEVLNIETLPLAEMNILTVVISGLGLLSLVKFGNYGRKVRFTPGTYLTAIAAMGLLIFGSLLYSLSTVRIAVDDSLVTCVILALSVLVSFYLALEEAWIEALERFELSPTVDPAMEGSGAIAE